ncbi:MAG: phosphotransferase [Acidimicrobiales bacterium]
MQSARSVAVAVLVQMAALGQPGRAGGCLTGVIDWGAAGVGDPAYDAMLAFDMPVAARRLYRADLGFDDATWARAGLGRSSRL